MAQMAAVRPTRIPQSRLSRTSVLSWFSSLAEFYSLVFYVSTLMPCVVDTASKSKAQEKEPTVVLCLAMLKCTGSPACLQQHRLQLQHETSCLYLQYVVTLGRHRCGLQSINHALCITHVHRFHKSNVS
jgi:hypothetical protein